MAIPVIMKTTMNICVTEKWPPRLILSCQLGSSLLTAVCTHPGKLPVALTTVSIPEHFSFFWSLIFIEKSWRILGPN